MRQRLRTPVRIFAAALAIGFALAARAEPFQEGVDAYQSEEYAEARERFEAALATGETAAARHNLALALARLESPAEAVWQLERAVRLEPFDREYRFKLGALRRRLGLSEGPPAWHALAAGALSLRAWTTLAAATLWIGLALLFLPRVAAPGSRPAPPIRIVRGLCALAFLLAASAAFLQLRDRRTGVVTAPQAAPLNAAPAAGAPQTAAARPGERARILDHHKNHIKIETESGLSGWIAAGDFRPIYRR